MTVDELRLMPDDLRECGYCARGSRVMANQLGIDWSLFLQEGIPLSQLEIIDDAMIQVLVKHVQGKHQNV